MVSWQVALVMVFIALIAGFMIGAIFFVDSGGVATTDDWSEQQTDQRRRRHNRENV